MYTQDRNSFKQISLNTRVIKIDCFVQRLCNSKFLKAVKDEQKFRKLNTPMLSVQETCLTCITYVLDFQCLENLLAIASDIEKQTHVFVYSKPLAEWKQYSKAVKC